MFVDSPDTMLMTAVDIRFASLLDPVLRPSSAASPTAGAPYDFRFDMVRVSDANLPSFACQQRSRLARPFKRRTRRRLETVRLGRIANRILPRLCAWRFLDDIHVRQPELPSSTPPIPTHKPMVLPGDGSHSQGGLRRVRGALQSEGQHLGHDQSARRQARHVWRRGARTAVMMMVCHGTRAMAEKNNLGDNQGNYK